VTPDFAMIKGSGKVAAVAKEEKANNKDIEGLLLGYESRGMWKE
jgi:hypothetical protein